MTVRGTCGKKIRPTETDKRVATTRILFVYWFALKNFRRKLCLRAIKITIFKGRLSVSIAQECHKNVNETWARRAKQTTDN